VRVLTRLRYFAATLTVLATAACGDGDPPLIAMVGGPAYLDAARMAIEDAGLPASSFDTLLIAEASSRAAPALAVANRIVETPGVVAVVGHTNSAASLVTAPIYNGVEVVQVTPSATAVMYSEAGPYSFRIVPSDDRQGPFLADALKQAFPEGGRIALFYVNDDYGRGLRDAVREALDTDLFTVGVDLPHLEEGVTEDDIDRAGVALRASPPDAILFLGRPGPLGQYLPTIRAQLPQVPVYGGDAVARAVILPQPPEFWDGVAYSDFVNPDANERVRAFVRRFVDREGHGATGAEILFYDATTLLLEGLEAGARNGPEMQAYLRSLGRDRPAFDGLSGPISFDGSGDVQGASYVLRWLSDPP